jgi:hypothetical protein
MRQLFKLSDAPVAALSALIFVAIAAPASAHTYEYCRRDVTSYMLSCAFDTMAQCQAMSSGRGSDCLSDPFEGAHLLEWLDWSYPVLQRHYEIRDGQVHVPEVPGVGLEWDEKAVAANLV